MDIEKNKERIKLQFDVIKRTDGYISTTNNKAALLLAANGALATIFTNKISEFSNLFGKSDAYSLVFFVFIFLISSSILLSISYSLKSIVPDMRTSTLEDANALSNISFVYISRNSDYKEYYNKFKSVSEDEILIDMCAQSYILSNIAKVKFNHFSSAVGWSKFAFVVIIILVILKFIDYINGVFA